MKKLLLAGLIAAITFPTQAEEPAKNKPSEPKIVISVYDVSNKVARDTGERKLSRTNKNLRLCWAAIGMPLNGHTTLVETFTSPKGGNFTASGVNVVSKEQKTKHIITTKKQLTQNAEFVDSCWQFDKKDPIGNYSIQVKVDDVTFPTVPFTITK